MRRIIGVAIVVLMIFGIVNQLKAADATIDTPFVTGYLWRGLLVNDEAVFQPMATLAASNGFAFYTWANLPLTDQNMFGEDKDDAFEFSEVDLIIEYTHNLGIEKASVSIGCAQWLYPDPTYEEENAAPTREIYVVASYATFLSPTLSLNYDVDDNDGGFYGNFQIGHEINLSKKISLGLNASIGWANSDFNQYYLGYDDSAFTDLTASVHSSYQLADNVSFSATVTCCTIPDSDVEDAAEATYYNDGDTVVGSVGISFSF